jgi:hypothetical protein
MGFKLTLALFALICLANITHAEVVEPIADISEIISDNNFKITVGGTVKEIFAFVKEFGSIMSHIKDVRQMFQKDPENTADIISLFDQYNTSSLCGTCQNLVGHFREYESPESTILCVILTNKIQRA